MDLFLIAILLIAAAIDLRSRKIPNLLTMPAALIAVIYRSSVYGWEGLFFSLGGLFLGVAIFFIPYYLGGMGAGDAKLVGVIGAVIGPKDIIVASLLIGIVGGIYALVILCFKRRYAKKMFENLWVTLNTFFLTKRIMLDPIEAKESQPKLCYGVAIAGGTFVYMLLKSTGYTFF